MKSFKDETGRTWEIAITVSQVRRVRDLCEVDLLDVEHGRTFTDFASDPVKLANCLYVLCKDQCDKHGMTDEQFGELLAGDTIDAATDALVGAVIDFFPKRRRDLLTRAAALSEKVADAAAQRMYRTLDDPATVEQLLAELSSEPFTSAPESSESTPGR